MRKIIHNKFYFRPFLILSSGRKIKVRLPLIDGCKCELPICNLRWYIKDSSRKYNLEYYVDKCCKCHAISSYSFYSNTDYSKHARKPLRLKDRKFIGNVFPELKDILVH